MGKKLFRGLKEKKTNACVFVCFWFTKTQTDTTHVYLTSLKGKKALNDGAATCEWTHLIWLWLYDEYFFSLSSSSSSLFFGIQSFSVCGELMVQHKTMHTLYISLESSRILKVRPWFICGFKCAWSHWTRHNLNIPISVYSDFNR